MPDISLLTHEIIGFDLETRDPAIKTHGPGWPWRQGEVVGIALDTQRTLQSVARWIEASWPDVDVVDDQIEII